jgi:hypothetical protein
MDFLKTNKFEEIFNLERNDIYENGKLSYSIYTNLEFDILFVVETDLNYKEDTYFNSKIYGKTDEKYHYSNCFFILNSINHFYLIPFLLECPESQKLNDFNIIVDNFEIAKHDSIQRMINNEYENLKNEYRDLIYNTNKNNKHFYNYWLKYGDLKKFEYNENIKIELPRYIYSDKNFNLNILEPEEITNPNKEGEGYRYLMKNSYFIEYISCRNKIIEVFSKFCKKNNLNFIIVKERYFSYY